MLREPGASQDDVDSGSLQYQKGDYLKGKEKGEKSVT